MLAFKARMATGLTIMVVQCFCFQVQTASYDLARAHVNAGLIICCYITGHQLRPEQKFEMIRYLRSRQNGDGGWGLYVLPLIDHDAVNTFYPELFFSFLQPYRGNIGNIWNWPQLCCTSLAGYDASVCMSEIGCSCLFVVQGFLLTTLTLRALVDSCSRMEVARGFHNGERCGSLASASTHGTASTRFLPSSGDSLTGFHSILAAGGATAGARLLFKLFSSLQTIHRVVYLPMGYLYGLKATAKETPLIREIRSVRFFIVIF